MPVCIFSKLPIGSSIPDASLYFPQASDWFKHGKCQLVFFSKCPIGSRDADARWYFFKASYWSKGGRCQVVSFQSFLLVHGMVKMPVSLFLKLSIGHRESRCQINILISVFSNCVFQVPDDQTMKI